jgi:threonine/homoserine/homoserine lactone efflux protein
MGVEARWKNEYAEINTGTHHLIVLKSGQLSDVSPYLFDTRTEILVRKKGVFVLIGFFVGFIAAIPLGPINIFIISQTMKRDFIHGYAGGLTAAVLDALYCLLAILGISRLASDFAKYGLYLKVIASVFLVLLAWRLFRHARQEAERKPDLANSKFSPRPLIAVVLMYVSNPTLYAFWIAVAGMAHSHEWVQTAGVTPYLFAASCGLGGSAWYFILTHYVSKHHHQFSPRVFKAVLIGLAVVLTLFAGYTFLSVFLPHRT